MLKTRGRSCVRPVVHCFSAGCKAAVVVPVLEQFRVQSGGLLAAATKQRIIQPPAAKWILGNISAFDVAVLHHVDVAIGARKERAGNRFRFDSQGIGRSRNQKAAESIQPVNSQAHSVWTFLTYKAQRSQHGRRRQPIWEKRGLKFLTQLLSHTVTKTQGTCGL